MATAEMRFSGQDWECEAVMALVLWRTAAVAVEEHLFLASPHDRFGGQEGHETT